MREVLHSRALAVSALSLGLSIACGQADRPAARPEQQAIGEQLPGESPAPASPATSEPVSMVRAPTIWVSAQAISVQHVGAGEQPRTAATEIVRLTEMKIPADEFRDGELGFHSDKLLHAFKPLAERYRTLLAGGEVAPAGEDPNELPVNLVVDRAMPVSTLNKVLYNAAHAGFGRGIFFSGDSRQAASFELELLGIRHLALYRPDRHKVEIVGLKLLISDRAVHAEAERLFCARARAPMICPSSRPVSGEEEGEQPSSVSVVLQSGTCPFASKGAGGFDSAKISQLVDGVCRANQGPFQIILAPDDALIFEDIAAVAAAVRAGLAPACRDSSLILARGVYDLEGCADAVEVGGLKEHFSRAD